MKDHANFPALSVLSAIVFESILAKGNPTNFDMLVPVMKPKSWINTDSFGLGIRRILVSATLALNPIVNNYSPTWR